MNRDEWNENVALMVVPAMAAAGLVLVIVLLCCGVKA